MGQVQRKLCLAYCIFGLALTSLACVRLDTAPEQGVDASAAIEDANHGDGSVGISRGWERGQDSSEQRSARRERSRDDFQRWGAYPLAICPVDGIEFDSTPDLVIYNHNWREFLFCSENCADRFEADPDPYIEAVDAEIIALQKSDYPFNACFVSDELLIDELSIDKVYFNTLLRFCCEDCVVEFETNPRVYFRKLRRMYRELEEPSVSDNESYQPLNEPEPEPVPDVQSQPSNLSLSNIV